jgi:hypothetical protein
MLAGTRGTASIGAVVRRATWDRARRRGGRRPSHLPYEAFFRRIIAGLERGRPISARSRHDGVANPNDLTHHPSRHGPLSWPSEWGLGQDGPGALQSKGASRTIATSVSPGAPEAPLGRSPAGRRRPARHSMYSRLKSDPPLAVVGVRESRTAAVTAREAVFELGIAGANGRHGAVAAHAE